MSTTVTTSDLAPPIKADPAVSPVKAEPGISPWIIAFTVMLATFMEVLDTSVANVSLPHIAGNLSASVDESTWILTSYLISNAIVLPLTGWLSTLFGRKRLFIGCVIIFTISSFLCGLAPNLFCWFSFASCKARRRRPPADFAGYTCRYFPARKAGHGDGVYGMGVVVAPIIGPTLGGWITDSYSWRWIFFLNVPIGMLSVLYLVLIHDPAYMVRKTFKQGLKIDFLGIGLLTVGLGFLQVGSIKENVTIGSGRLSSSGLP